jgi:outer membrane protein TolC
VSVRPAVLSIEEIMRQPLAVGLLALGLSPWATGQELTEGQFLAGVGEGHAAVRALQESLGVAEAARIRSGTLSNPRVDFWREQPESSPRVTNWTISWTPPLDGRFGLGKQAADAGVAAATERLVADRARLRNELRRVFAEWSLAGERRAVLASQTEHVKALAETERQRARVGEAAGLSSRRFSLAEAETRAALRDAEAGLARTQAVARAWRPDLGPQASARPSVLPEPPSDLGLEAPETRALAREIEQWELEARRSGRFWGFPTLQAGWQRLDDHGVVRDGPIFAANWSIPLFDRNRAAQIEAKRRGEAAQARLELTRSRLAAEVQGGLAAFRLLVTSASEAREAAEESTRVIDAATAWYRAGEMSLTDLLDALRAAFAARARELETRGRALEAHRALELAVGHPLSGGQQ